MSNPPVRKTLATGGLALAAALALSTLTAPAAFAAAPTNVIADVQGTGDVTPLAGSTVTVQGVITGDYRAATASGLKGFYLEDAAPDNADGRSDGIFVYSADANPAVAIGDLVTVTGVASEFNGQTQISATTDAAFELVTAAAGAPAPVTLPDAAVGAAREAYEGMLVTPQSAYLSSSHQLDRFGTLWLSVGALAVKATETTDAGDAANAIAAANRANRLLVDDGYSIQTSNAAHPGDEPYFTADNVIRTGDKFVSPAAGMILGWGFTDWRLQPQRPVSTTSPAEYAALEPTWTTANPRPDAPAAVGGDFSVATFNVNNYFTDFGGNARGAKTPEAFAVQQSKVVSAITGLNAGIVTLSEMENSIKFGHPADTSLANLVDALNAASAPGTWAYVPTPTTLLDAATTDFITNAIIYQPAIATPVGASIAAVDEAVWNIAREPIAQTFTVDGTILTVIANHLKSKNPPAGNTAPEPSDLQGFFNAERTAQAASVRDFAAGIQADPAKGPNVLILGDFNAYHQEDPVQVLTTAGYTDVVAEKTTEYTYTFDGELGSLDHVFASPALSAKITGADVWNINSPEWSARGYDGIAGVAGTPFRSSDHDPIKVGVSAAVAPVAVDMLSINDFHGRLEANPPAAGAAVLAGMVDSYRAANPNTVFVGAGDLIGASTFTSFIQKDKPTIDAFNQMGLDASALGNHEFDQGRADVDDRILPAANWDYLSANLYDKTTGKPAYQEYSIKKFGSVSVAFVGAVTEQLPSLVSPAGIATLEVKPVVPEVNRVADQLSDGNPANGEADVVVLLVHEGAETPDVSSATNDSLFGRIVNGADANIDAIVSGHTHLAYNHQIPIAGTDKTRLVISSGQYGEKYAHTTLSIDPKTHTLLSAKAEVLPLAGAFPPNAIVAKTVADAVAVAKDRGAVKVGDITASLNRARQTAGTENRGGESTLGNLVADAQLEATKDLGAKLALMNPGGLRTDLKYASSGATDPDGNLTYAEAAAVQPFANTLVTLDLTGAQLRQVLEEQWQPAGSTRPFLKLGLSASVKYSYNPAAAAGSRITAVYVDGALVDSTATFRVTVNSFLASGGDNFATLVKGTNRTDSGRIDLQSFVDYFVKNPTVTPDYRQRSVGVVLSAPDADGYSAGDSVTVTLSSLLFSAGEPNAGTAVVSLGGSQVGSAAIDPTIVDATDEVGRASVSITVPAGTPAGASALTITVPETGTTIAVPITFTAIAVPIVNTALPTITGTASVGSVLSATGGTWSVDAPALAYQWSRGGVPIAGAVAATYTLVGADAGAAITVTVTASKAGSLDGSATSAAVTVGKISSRVSASTNRVLVFGGQSLTYTVTVRAAGLTPSGDVAIYDGSRLITTVALGADGTVKVPITGLRSGFHLLTARYAGNAQVTGAASTPSLVIKF